MDDETTSPALVSALASAFAVEQVPLASLQPHPQNYQSHPQDELDQIKASIEEHGIFRNVVVARDGTILAGHGVCQAAEQLGIGEIPVRRLPYEPNDPRAIKVLIADNEIRHLAERDDRRLTELLRNLAEEDALLGTGYDEMMVANLLLVTRPASEIPDLDTAAQWTGVPEYEGGGDIRLQIIVNFTNEADRLDFCNLIGLDSNAVALGGPTKTIRWPLNDPRLDLTSVRFTSRGAADQDYQDDEDQDQDQDDDEG
jgi:hypothetical protein